MLKLKLVKNLIKIVAFIILFIISINAHSQGFLNQKDLKNFKEETLSESEISKIKQQIEIKGISIDQLERQSIEKGMNPNEFAKLKTRLNLVLSSKGRNNSIRGFNQYDNKFGDTTFTDSLNFDKNNVRKLNPLIYGSELFAETNKAFEPNQNLAAPFNYIIGPNDGINIVVYGVQEFSSNLKVEKDGSIQFPNVGPIKILGLNIESATQKIKQLLSNSIYPSLKNNESKLYITVDNLRTIQVTVIGAIKSGKFNVSSLSNVLSVLSEAGGPNEIGSFRNIELIRKNKVIKVIDLYDFMQTGDQSQILNLTDNDVIRVPAYSSRVEIKGQVKRPGYFEIKNNETFKDLLKYAGGFDDTAYTSMVKVIQKTDKEKAIKDLSNQEFNNYFPQSGDLFIISKINNRFQNKVSINGSIYRPDSYEYKQGMRVIDLINKADGLTEDAYLYGAQLFRLKKNLVKEIVSINLQKVLLGDSNHNILLQKDDELFISSVLDLKDSLQVQIEGEVRNPGKYLFIEGMSLKDLIILSGGINNKANSKIEVARMLNDDDSKENSSIVSKILVTEIDPNLNFVNNSNDILLKPYDVVTLTKKQAFAESEIVSISGQVQFEGKYTLSSRVERVSDILKRAGGLIGDAYGKGAFIKRESVRKDTLGIKIKDSLNKTNTKDNIVTYQIIALDIEKIINSPGSYADIILRNYDEIIIPKLDNKVTVRGGVLRPIIIPYRNGMTIGECISAAGGVSEYSRKSKAYVVYFNGRAKRTKQFGFIKINPKIEPGSEVVVPESGEKKKDVFTVALQFLTFAIQIGTSLATLRILSQ